MTKGLKIFLITFVVSLTFWLGINVFQKNMENFLVAQISEPFQSVIQNEIPQKPKLEILAKSAISLRIDGENKNKILFAKDIDIKLPIASVTKLMTALIIMDNPEEFSSPQIITISKKAADQGNTPNFGNLKAGEKYTLDKLFELMLVYSSNDAAYSLSEIIGTDDFILKMNQKAQELGMTNTHFTNPTGLDPKGLSAEEFAELNNFNYSTAKDISILSKYILDNYPLIFALSSNPNSYYSVENGVLNIILKEKQKIIGGKTGYTQKASGCVVFLFEDENKNSYINVILGTENEKARIIEMQKLTDWLSL